MRLVNPKCTFCHETIMHQLAKGYTDEQIVAIAGYFAAQKK